MPIPQFHRQPPSKSQRWKLSISFQLERVYVSFDDLSNGLSQSTHGVLTRNGTGGRGRFGEEHGSERLEEHESGYCFRQMVDSFVFGRNRIS